MSRNTGLLAVAALLALAATLVHEPDADRALERTRADLQDQLDEHAARLAGKTAELGEHLAAHGGTAWMQAYAAGPDPGGAIFLGFENDSLTCWSGQPMMRPGRLQHETGHHVHTTTGTWLHVRSEHGTARMHGLLPVRQAPPIENRYLRNRFGPGLHAPAGVLAHVPEDGQAHGPALTDPAGRDMLQLSWRDGALELGNWVRVRLLLFALAAALLVVAVWSLLRDGAPGRPWRAWLLFIAFLVTLRGALWLLLPGRVFQRLALFDPAVYASSAGFASVGDLVINVLLVMAAVRTFQLTVRRSPRARSPGPAAMFLGWAALFAFAAWATRVAVGIVDHSIIELDLRHIQEMGGFSVLALLAMALLVFSWTTAARTFAVQFIHGRPGWRPWAPALTAFAAVAAVQAATGPPGPLLWAWPLAVLGVIAFARRIMGRFGGSVALIVVLAAITTHILESRNQLREKRERRSLAERISTREDPALEQEFRAVAPRLGRDPRLYGMITGRRPCDPAELNRTVRQHFSSGYWERYDVRLFTFGTKGQAVCATDGETPRSFNSTRSAFAMPTAAADMPDLFIEEGPGQDSFYHARVAVMPSDTLEPAQLIVELYPRSAVQGIGFPALLLAGDDVLAQRVGRYDLARYENGHLVERSGNPHTPFVWSRPLGPDGESWYREGGYDVLALGAPLGDVIVLARPVPGLLARATSFSYMFALYSILFVLLTLGASVLRTGGMPTAGLGAKVRVALALFALAGSVFFGIGAQLLLARQYEHQFDKAMMEKARSVHQDMQQRLDGEPVLGRDHARYLDHLLGRLSNVYFTDITLYTLEGRMLATSRPQIFVAGLLGRRMDPVAYERLALAGMGSFIHQEAVGTATYRAAYLPLRDRDGTVLAYLALPGFADQDQQERDRAGVWVAVANLFALLFALSVLVALFISNWTTRPLDLLKNALARVDLRTTNEPIRYRGGDEVGQLVDVYNRKVEELRESAERLARSERESAWKEMARQVAHEIKNPLTPMKLSIQHFQRTWSPDAPDARERLDRFSNNLVEQIDVLSRIAGEFSHFAQMPPAHPAPLDLAEVADAAVHLFASTPGCTVHLRHDGPLPVHADREHLLRTFNNLIKNALQSIPEEREGRVDVLLRREGHEAVAEVRDNGLGIPEDTLHNIFVPKFTTKSSGMGLGLPMVKRMVENAGGRVWFETREGEGTSFYVALPLTDAHGS